MSDILRVLVVDDHPVVRKGVSALLADAADIAVVGEAADGRQAIAEARRLRPHVILMDLLLPELDGVAATLAILAENPGAGIVAMTSAANESMVIEAVEAGALGFLAKTSPREDFVDAIRRVAHGAAWLPPELTGKLLTHWRSRRSHKHAGALTHQEHEVLLRLAQGWSNRRIGGDLGIAESTVRTHVNRIFGKLGASNRVEAALYALGADPAPRQGP